MVLMFLLLIFSNLVPTNANAAVLILARGGSKGVPLKNLQTVGGRSLLRRAIHTAKLAGLEDVTVSTDQPLIALEAIRSGANIHLRRPITATDRAPSIWGAQEFMEKRSDINTLILIQATSPFLRKQTINLSLERLNYPIPFDCIFTVTRGYKLRWSLESKKATPLNFNPDARPQRQDWLGELYETGALYITRRPIINMGYFQNDNCTVYEVDVLESFDVDSPFDLKVANALANVNGY